MSTVYHLSDADFKSQVLQSTRPTLVDFWAPWCGPCRTIGPVLDELAIERAGSVKIAKLNVDENPNAAATYQIDSIPTLLLFKGGEIVGRLVGLQPKAELERVLDQAAA